jgi:NAD(P)-dependent dehydrogenase (short-subunit alcohol dehydrogenase family)
MNVVITGTDYDTGLGHTLKMIMRRRYADTVIGSRHDVTHDGRDDDPYLDLTKLADILNYANFVRAAMPHIDVLVHNAGEAMIAKFEDVKWNDLHRLMQVNCFGPIALTQQLLPNLRRGAQIIFILSDASTKPMRCSLGYNLSKAAADMAVRQMARELTKPKDLSIYGIRPGRIAGTRLIEHINAEVCRVRDWTPEFAATYAYSQGVTGLDANVEDVAQSLAQFIHSPMSRNLSGARMDFTG